MEICFACILQLSTPLPVTTIRRSEMIHDDEEPIYYTARHLMKMLDALDDRLLDLPLVLVHGKELTKPNLVSGIIPAPIPVDRAVVEAKKPSLLAFADFLD